MSTIPGNPSLTTLISIGRAVKNYGALIESEIFEEDIGQDGKTLHARKAGFAASLSLYFNNLSHLINSNELQEQARAAVDNMTEEALNGYDQTTIIQAPEILNHYLNTLRTWMTKNINNNIDDMVEHITDELNISEEAYGAEIQKGAKDIFIGWLDQYHEEIKNNRTGNLNIKGNLMPSFLDSRPN